MLSGLLTFTSLTSRTDAPSAPGSAADLPADYTRLLDEHGGSSFGRGLYRIHTLTSAVEARARILEYHIAAHGMLRDILPVGFDWLGREWVAQRPDEKNTETDGMYLLDPSSAEILTIPIGIVELHGAKFAEEGASDLLEMSWYEAYRAYRRWDGDLSFESCVGHRQPLILGGEDDFDNLEEWDRDVYWSVCGQAYNQLANLVPNDSIDEFTIVDGE